MEPADPDSSPPHTQKKTHYIAKITLVSLVVLRTLTIGPTQFLGSQGWAYVLDNLTMPGKNPLATEILHQARPRSEHAPELLQQAIAHIVNSMSLTQKIGQMMMVQFVGPDYSLDLNTMITQYDAGSVLLFDANGNIISKNQLTQLTRQIQLHMPVLNVGNIPLPLTIATDQEGGAVDRLRSLAGAEPSEAALGLTNDLSQARAAGERTAQELSGYGINLNLAPVVDIDTTENSELHNDGRTFGRSATIVTQMASAYLEGLQQSGKVLGTLKHFPGLGSVTVDPHTALPLLNRSEAALEQTDWTPYKTLIQQQLAHAIMVTHELVPAIDPLRPSSLSPLIVQDILRDQLGFQGVIMTDSLTMASITTYISSSMDAAVMAIEAGSDILMGASTPDDVANMENGIQQAVNDGTISMARIDASLHRILLLKYQLGLLPMLTNE